MVKICSGNSIFSWFKPATSPRTRPRLQPRHGPQQAPRLAACGVARGLPGLARMRHGGGGDAPGMGLIMFG